MALSGWARGSGHTLHQKELFMHSNQLPDRERSRVLGTGCPETTKTHLGTDLSILL